jgi:hypothetical protein
LSSGGEFPLTLLLQIQDDMSSQLQGIRSDIQGLSTETDNLSNRVKTSSGGFVQLGLGVAAAASGVLNLVRQFHNLQRAHNTVTASQNRLENAQKNYNKAVKAHGKNSDEAKKAANNLENAELRLKNQQVALSDRMTDFAFSVVPSVIGVVAGLSQVFQTFGGGGGLAGLGTGVLKFGGALAVVGVALFAFKTNLFGFRDAINQIGVAIGNAIPVLKPFLDFLSNMATLIGLQPGNKKAAGKFVNNFIDGLKEAFAGAQKKVEKIISKLFSGDIAGTIKQITFTIKDIARHIIIDGTPLDQLPTRIQNHFKAAMAQHKGDLLSATADVLVFIGNIFFGQVTGGTTGKKYSFGDAVKLGIQKRIDEAKGNPVTLTLNFADFFNLQFGNPIDLSILKGNVKGVTDIINSISTALHNLDVALGGGAAGRLKALGDAIDATKAAAWLVFSAALKLIQPALSFLQQNAPTWWAAFVASASTAVSTAWILLGAAFELVKSGISFLLQNAPTWWASFITSVNNTVSAAWLVYGIAATAVSDALKTIEGITIPTQITDLIASVDSTVSAAWDTFGTAIDKVSKALSSLNGIKTTVFENLLKLWNAIHGKGFTTDPTSFGIPNGDLNNSNFNSPDSLVMCRDKFGNPIPCNKNAGNNDKSGANTLFRGDKGPFTNQLVSQDNSNGGDFMTNIQAVQAALTQIQTSLSSTAAAASAMFNSFGANAQSGAQQITAAFSPIFQQISAGFTGLANTVSAVMNSFGANARSGTAQVQAAFTPMFITLEQAMNILNNEWSTSMNAFGANAASGAKQALSALSKMFITVEQAMNILNKEWSASMNAMGKNAQSGANQVTSAFKKMQSQATSIFNNINKTFSSAMNHMAAAASSAANKIVSSMHKIESAAKAAAAAVAKVGSSGKAKGGIISAASGKLLTTTGQQTVTVGDNPGGRESIWAIPHNDPGPTINQILGMYGRLASSSISSSRVSGTPISGGSSGPIIVQVFLDGEQIKGKVVKMISANQTAIR